MQPPSSGSVWQHGPLKRRYPTTTLHCSHNSKDLDVKLHRRDDLKISPLNDAFRVSLLHNAQWTSKNYLRHVKVMVGTHHFSICTVDSHYSVQGFIPVCLKVIITVLPSFWLGFHIRCGTNPVQSLSCWYLLIGKSLAICKEIRYQYFSLSVESEKQVTHD
jgi:hypothetical protein